MSAPSLSGVRRDLERLSGWDVVAYGSWAAGAWTPRSDVDVAVLTRSPARRTNEEIWWALLGTAPDRYDIRVFELLPIHVQAEIARQHVVVFGDPRVIGEYLHPVHRRWADVRHRYESPLPIRERLARAQRR